jgi:hypothetical protein
MAIVQQEGERLVIVISPEEAMNIQAGDIVKIIKVDSPMVSQAVKDATAEALRKFAEDLEYLKDR